MSSTRLQAHNPKLIAGIVHCDANIETGHHLCHGWFGDGWKWHACEHTPGHDGNHRCPCGHTWKPSHRLPRGRLA